MADNVNNDLVRLKDMEDFEIAEHEPDPRGWHVISADGRDIGKVDELIVDASARKVRYMDVDVAEGDLGLEEEDRHVLVPVGYAQLDEDEEQVRVDQLESSDVANLPAFRGLPMTRDQEVELETRFRGGMERKRLREERPRREELGEEMHIARAEEELDITKREREAGEVDIETEIDTERVRRPVTRRHEEVEIERRAVEPRPARADELKEEEIRIPLHEEQVEVGKRPVVKEELVVRKRPVEETEEVEADIRKERIEVEEHGNIEEQRGRRER